MTNDIVGSKRTHDLNVACPTCGAVAGTVVDGLVHGRRQLKADQRPEDEAADQWAIAKDLESRSARRIAER